MKYITLFALVVGGFLILPYTAQAQEGGCFWCVDFNQDGDADCVEMSEGGGGGNTLCIDLEGTTVCYIGGNCHFEGDYPEGGGGVLAFLSGSSTLRMVAQKSPSEPRPLDLSVGAVLVRACQGVVIERRYSVSRMREVRESTSSIVL